MLQPNTACTPHAYCPRLPHVSCGWDLLPHGARRLFLTDLRRSATAPPFFVTCTGPTSLFQKVPSRAWCLLSQRTHHFWNSRPQASCVVAWRCAKSSFPISYRVYAFAWGTEQHLVSGLHVQEAFLWGGGLDLFGVCKLSETVLN